MIVLRLTVHGVVSTIESPKPRLVLGSGDDADVSAPGAEWRPLEAILLHQGTEVRVEQLDGESWRLRVGDTLRLGRARIALIGLLPLPAAAYEAPPIPAPPRAGAAPPASVLSAWGGYGNEAPADPSKQPFQLEGEAAARGVVSRPSAAAPPPPKPPAPPAAPPQTPAPAPASAAPPAPPSSKPPPASAPSPSPQPSEPSEPREPGTPAADKPPPSRSTKAVPPPRPPHPAFRDTHSFGEELVRQLRHAPYLTVSLAVHIAAFFVFAFLQTGPTVAGSTGKGGSIAVAEYEPPEVEEERAFSDETDTTPVLEPDLTEIPEPLLPEIEAPEPTQPKIEPSLERLPDPGGAPIPVGLHPSVQALGRLDSRTRPIPKMELQKAFSEGDKDSVHLKAATAVRADLGLGTGRRGDPFAKLEKKDLLVVAGSFDKIGRVLQVLRVPYTLVTPLSLTFDGAPDLSQHKVIFWNCGDAIPPARRPIVARKLERFVKEGGYLFTTDWSVGTVLMPSFPGMLSTRGPVDPLPETVIDIEPAPGKSSHPLLKGVFHLGVQGRWWLEKASFDIRVVNKRDVEVLIVSRELEDRLQRSPVVAATFRHGRGRVLHMMGHYYQEEGNLAGTISAQRLALNFILERLSRNLPPRRNNASRRNRRRKN